MAKILDVELKGNLARIYCGDDSLEDWWGDDWDDAPYEHNAGTVYDRYVSKVVDIAFPFDAIVAEPCLGEWNSRWCKRDMMERHVACLAALRTDPDETWRYESFGACVADDRAVRVYMGDDVESTLISLVVSAGAVVFE